VTDYDVLVAGSGPAGAVTALRLAQAGCTVALAGRPAQPARTGETLAPAAGALLRSLGLWPRFAALQSLPSWGLRSVWGRAEPDDRSHLIHPDGPGWQVDRHRFDAMLAAAAHAAGVVAWPALGRVHYDNSRWVAESAAGATVTGRVLVDATGRRAAVGRSLGARRIAFDRQVALAGWWPQPREGGDHALVEAADDGWWYSAPAPGGRLAGMLFTDADLCRRFGLAGPGGWRRALRSAPWTAARLPGCPADAPRVLPAASHRLVRTGDERPWLAVGDAALAVDPLSGGGMLRALRGSAGTAAAAQAARTAAAAQAAGTAAAAQAAGTAAAAQAAGAVETAMGLLCGRSGVAAYEAALDDDCTAHLRERRAYYAAARRRNTPFWTRRAPAEELSPGSRPR
jgi:2-polyprenyl-6-methoxyphenol hydroxylase-like FAD-dependent oxidoreductase